MGDGGTRIHQWLYPLATFHQRMGMTGGKGGPDDAVLQAVFARTGSYVMGRRMFAGLVDDLTIHLAPVLIGQGVRLFDHWADADVRLEPTEAIASSSVAHLSFRGTK